MEESMHDILERMESLIPEYSYSSISDIVKTDKKVKELLLSEMKQIKDYLFHIVQVSYELQRDQLSDAAESSWDDVDSLVDRLENAKLFKFKGDKKSCDECKKKVESELQNLIRRDRELVMEVRDLKRTVYLLYRALFDQGREKHFINSLGKIKKYVEEISTLLDIRENIIAGG